MTDTALNSLPADRGSFSDRARGYATSAQERVSSAASATVDAAKDHPYAAAGIAVGVAAAVGGRRCGLCRDADGIIDALIFCAQRRKGREDVSCRAIDPPQTPCHPREGGDPYWLISAIKSQRRMIWIPAFAGMAGLMRPSNIH